MSAKDALLFIDANKYLDLYRTDKGRKLLSPLAEQAPYIFITQQVVDEVHRNKLSVASGFLRKKIQDINFASINVPDHFSGSEDGKNKDILSKLRAISTMVTNVNEEIDSHTLEIMAQVAESKDEVSIELEPIFSKAVQATPDELKRARERKEAGNPPGKRNDPLGDEITWEQILSHFDGKKHLWIISRDGDYSTQFRGKSFINGLLKSDLLQITEDANIYIFEDLIEGLTHFVKTTKVTAEEKLTPEEIKEIEAEEKSLPSIKLPKRSYIGGNIGQTVANIGTSNLDAIQAAMGVSNTESLKAVMGLSDTEALKAVMGLSDTEALKAAMGFSDTEALKAAIDVVVEGGYKGTKS